MPLTLEEYDHQIGFPMKMIRQHAERIAHYANRMTHQPGFEALAEDELAKLDHTLATALGRVRHALETYRGKPRDR
jgi:hypothetical protein